MMIILMMTMTLAYDDIDDNDDKADNEWLSHYLPVMIMTTGTC